jgi:hypothetical protein
VPVAEDNDEQAARRLAAEFAEKMTVSVHAAYDVLSSNLADRVEVRHRPAVPELDGWRSRQRMQAYLAEELVAFPRAFCDDLQITTKVEVRGSSFLLDPMGWQGTLNWDTKPFVDIGIAAEVDVEDGLICRITGYRGTQTGRNDYIAWLKATAANGGFTPPPPDLAD